MFKGRREELKEGESTMKKKGEKKKKKENINGGNLDRQECTEFVNRRELKIVEIFIMLTTILFSFFHSLRVFHNNVSWWSFNGVWVMSSLFSYPGLCSVFWLILTYCIFDSHNPFSDFQFLLSFFQVFMDRCKCINYN